MASPRSTAFDLDGIEPEGIEPSPRGRGILASATMQGAESDEAPGRRNLRSSPIDGGEGRLGGLVPGWWRGPFPVLLIALWFGLVAGLLELTFLVTRVQVFENGAWMRSPHSVWMVPVSNILLAAAGGLFLGLLARARPRWGRRLVVGTLVTLACLSQLLLIRGLNLFTCVLIAAGLARQLTPFVIARWPRFLSLVRRSLPSLLGVVVALVGFSFARDSFARHRANEGRPEVSGRAPNVLLIVLDTVRADRLSLYGYGRDTTPNLARLARRGVRFDRARSTAPWTLPSHASMFTGRWPHELAVERHRPLDATYPTLAEFLRDRGYATVGVVANTVLLRQRSPAWAAASPTTGTTP